MGTATRVALVVVTLVAGLGVGMAVGAARSERAACLKAIRFAEQEMVSSTDFARHIADFFEADAAKDVARMEAIVGALGPVTERTGQAVKGFMSAKKKC